MILVKRCQPLSTKITNMSIVCAVLVVCIHTHMNPPLGGFIWWLKLILFDALAAIAVPFFFIVSGYFLARYFNEPGWWSRALKKRFHSLLIPYCMWCLIWLMVINLLIPITANLLAERSFTENIVVQDLSILRGFGGDLLHNPAVPALWYIRAILLFILFAPILKRLATLKGVVFLFIVYLLICPSSALIKIHPYFYFLRFFFSLEGLFYFTLGLWFADSYSGFDSLCIRKYGLGGAVILLVTYMVACYFGFRFSYYFVTLGIPFWLYMVWSLIPEKRWPTCVTQCSFTIFLSHQLFFILLDLGSRHWLSFESYSLSPIRLLIGLCCVIGGGSLGGVARRSNLSAYFVG